MIQVTLFAAFGGATKRRDLIQVKLFDAFGGATKRCDLIQVTLFEAFVSVTKRNDLIQVMLFEAFGGAAGKRKSVTKQILRKIVPRLAGRTWGVGPTTATADLIK